MNAWFYWTSFCWHQGRQMLWSGVRLLWKLLKVQSNLDLSKPMSFSFCQVSKSMSVVDLLDFFDAIAVCSKGYNAKNFLQWEVFTFAKNCGINCNRRAFYMMNFRSSNGFHPFGSMAVLKLSVGMMPTFALPILSF